MAVERVKILDIDNKIIATAIIGNVADIFIDIDLKKYSFNQQLYIYLKELGFQIIVFYDTNKGISTYEKNTFDLFLDPTADDVDNPIKQDNSGDGRPINGRRFNKKNETSNSGNSDLYKWENEQGENVGIWVSTSKCEEPFVKDKIKTILQQTRLKTAIIFNSPDSLSNKDDDIKATISEIKENSSITNNSNKILIKYRTENNAEFIRYFGVKTTLFADNLFRDLFIEGENINKSNVFKVPFPMQDECRNLLNYHRLKNSKTVEWNEFENIVKMLVAENKPISENENKLEKIPELSMAELIKEGVVKSETITFCLQKIQSTLDKIKGQEENIDIIVRKVMVWANDKKKTKPLSFFLVGKSGTGKTLTAETFQTALIESGFDYVYLDMNAYKDSSTYSKLLGSAPGYVGSTETPKLFAEIKKNRRLVICFDEIEKAHSDILTTLMQMLDKGELSNNNYTGNFKECILFFTSNLAQEKVIEAKVNLLREKSTVDIRKLLTDTQFKQQIRDILEKAKPEIPSEVWGRIDNYLVYNQLSAKDVIEIAIHLIKENATEKGIKIADIAPEYLSHLAKKHSNTKYGMRDLKTEIKDEITNLTENQDENI